MYADRVIIPIAALIHGLDRQTWRQIMPASQPIQEDSYEQIDI